MHKQKVYEFSSTVCIEEHLTQLEHVLEICLSSYVSGNQVACLLTNVATHTTNYVFNVKQSFESRIQGRIPGLMKGATKHFGDPTSNFTFIFLLKTFLAIDANLLGKWFRVGELKLQPPGPTPPPQKKKNLSKSYLKNTLLKKV